MISSTNAVDQRDLARSALKIQAYKIRVMKSLFAKNYPNRHYTHLGISVGDISHLNPKLKLDYSMLRRNAVESER